MFAVFVTFQIKPADVDVFMPLMIQNARTSRADEPGCQQFDVCQNGTEVFLYELYDDRAAFDAHLASDHFKEFDAAVDAMIVEKNVRLFDEVVR